MTRQPATRRRPRIPMLQWVRLLAGLILFLGTAGLALSEESRQGLVSSPERTAVRGGETSQASAPRLVNLIVIDQFPAEYLDLYGDLLGEAGIRRLMRDGAWFAEANFSYGATTTGPGHATIATGANPRTHGIVGNSWFDADLGRDVYCVEDPRYPLLPPKSSDDGASPRWLLTATIGDALKQKMGDRAKVWALSLKDRSAVFMGGHNADGVLWWSSDSGDFVSSRYYFDELPAWVRRWNEEPMVESYFGTFWTRALPKSAYARCGLDDAPYETGPNVNLSNVLPKLIGEGVDSPGKRFYRALASTPYGNEIVFAAARTALLSESLGVDDVTDFLAIGLTSVDRAGHLFGPHSHEMLDMVVRTDGQIADWLHFLDRQIGMDKCLIVLTADHGVAPAPEAACEPHLSCGRFKEDDLRTALDEGLCRRLQWATPLKCIASIQLPWITLRDSTCDLSGLPRAAVAETLAIVARGFEAVATASVSPCLTSEFGMGDSTVSAKTVEGAYPGRSGDVYVHLKPLWQRTGGCTSHGTAHRHDTHVPLFLLGDEIRPGRYLSPCDLQDLAATVCAAIGIPAPAGSTGQVLREALPVDSLPR